MRIENFNKGSSKKFQNPTSKEIKQPPISPPRITEHHINKRKMPRPGPRMQRRQPKQSS